MARLARVIVPGMPHQITQRGNRRQATFFRDDDYTAYLDLMAEWCHEHNVEIWAYCLMPNHTHLVAVRQPIESTPKDGGQSRMIAVSSSSSVFSKQV